MGVLSTLAVMSGCAGSADAGSGGLPGALECETFYRAMPDASEFEEMPVRVELGASARASFPELIFSVTYGGDEYEGYSASLSVTDSESAQLMSVLYQLDEGGAQLRTDYVGGHGFTGLHYVDHAGVRLQFWCASA